MSHTKKINRLVRKPWTENYKGDVGCQHPYARKVHPSIEFGLNLANAVMLHGMRRQGNRE